MIADAERWHGGRAAGGAAGAAGAAGEAQVKVFDMKAIQSAP